MLDGAQALVLLTFGDALRWSSLAEAGGGERLAGMYGTVSGPSHEIVPARIWDKAFRNEYESGTAGGLVARLGRLLAASHAPAGGV